MNTELVWYAGYGSNLSRQRFACYLEGGTPEGAGHVHAGCRDRSPAIRTEPLTIRGRLTFAGASTIWGGGLAFLDADVEGTTYARGYLITTDQLDDVAVQETRYDSLTTVGHRDGLPILSLTSTLRPPPAPPSAAYLRTILTGLLDGILDVDGAVAYLLAADGVDLMWDVASLEALVEQSSAARG